MGLCIEAEERTLKSTPTEDLVDGACQGDAAAFGAIIRLLDHDLRGLAWSVVRNGHQVDDIMQATYEKAFRQIRTFRRGSSINTWLHSICYRTAIDLGRYEGRRRHEDIALAGQKILSNQPGTDDQVASQIEFEAIMDRLDPETRTILMLTTALGYSYDETAEITGLARGTVASRVARTKEKLRNQTP